MTLIKEIWKDIPNYEGLYQASNLGNIKSLERYNYKGHHNLERILKPTLCKNGYLYVNLCKNKKTKIIQVHKLIAITFLKNSNNYLCINHIDGNKTNNSVYNLEYCTYSHNEKEAYKLGLKKTIPTAQYDTNDNLIQIYKSRVEAEKATGINASSIWAVCKGQRKTAGGYKWKRISEVMKNDL